MAQENGSVTRRLAPHDQSLNDTKPDLPTAKALAPPGSPAAAEQAATPPAAAAKQRRWSPVWRAARLAVALGMTAAALWWMVVPFFFPVTSDAVVNARMVQVRAPIDGAAVEVLRDIGDPVQAGQPLLKVVSSQADTSHLAELAARRTGLAAQRERLASDLETATRTRDECRASTRRFYNEFVESLKASVKEADAKIEAAQVEREAAHVRAARAARLVLQQAGADSELDLARTDESVAAKKVEEGQAARARVEKELQSAEQGFLFQRDEPSSEQRADQLDVKLPELRAALDETDEKLAAAETEWQEEERRVGRLSEAAVASPVAGTVWKRNGEPGQVVKQNENLVEIADPRTIFVEALLPQSHLTAIAPGSKAVVRLSDGRVLGGRVRAVRTLGGASTEASFAINLPCPDVKQVHVLIDLDPGAQDAALIGRHARVFIADEQPGPMQQAMMWLFGRVGV